MRYNNLRTVIKTGDICGCEGKGFVQRIIRKATGQSFNHVAMFVWIEKGLYIFEFVEGEGFRFVPASQWVATRLKKKQYLYWGMAPKKVRDRPDVISAHVTTIREGKRSKRNYNYWELPVLWAANTFGFNVEELSGVCSTAISVAWKKCGFRFEKSPRPGDYMHYCETFTLINML